MKTIMMWGMLGMAWVCAAQGPVRVGPKPCDVELKGYVGNWMARYADMSVKGKDAEQLAMVFARDSMGKLPAWAGEYWGKWMTAAVPVWQLTGDSALRDKINRTVKFIQESQYDDGYIGSLPLQRRYRQSDWDIWCRKYTSLGLLAWYDATGDKGVLETVKKLCDQLMTEVGPKAPRAIATVGTHHGYASMGYLQVAAGLYARTKEQKYLDYANYIVSQMEDGDPKSAHLLSNALAGKDIASYSENKSRPFAWDRTNKSYEMTTCYLGLVEYWAATGNERALAAVKAAADNITRTELSLIGSGSTCEYWYHGAAKQTKMARCQNEGCTTILWMHLCRALLKATGEARWADEFERTFYNAFLASIKPDCTRFSMYFPLAGHRGEGPNQCNLPTHCCNENGPRGLACLLDTILLAEPGVVSVTQYMPGRAAIACGDNKVEIVQQTDYPASGKVKLVVNPSKPGRFTLRVRVPSWVTTEPTGWKDIVRDWKRGDEVVLDWPIKAKVHRQEGHLAYTWGPLALARDSRYNDGDTDDTIQLTGELRVDKAPHPGRWLSFVQTANSLGSLNMYTGERKPVGVHFCDFASAGNEWKPANRYRVWIPQLTD